MSGTLHPLLASRWSPRAFDATAELSDEQVDRLLEAARWAPSAANSQPWRFLLALRGSEAFDALFATLVPGNQLWAGHASALLLAAAEEGDADGGPAPWATYDTGQAVAALVTQAEHEGLATHQMGGFDVEAVRGAFSLRATVRPMTVVAIGTRGRVEQLPAPLAARETAPRTRRPLGELLLDGPVRRLANPSRRSA